MLGTPQTQGQRRRTRVPTVLFIACIAFACASGVAVFSLSDVREAPTSKLPTSFIRNFKIPTETRVAPEKQHGQEQEPQPEPTVDKTDEQKQPQHQQAAIDDVEKPEEEVDEAAPHQPSPSPLPQQEPKGEEEVKRRREAVKAAMIHSWKGYSSQAWGKDEVKPVTGESLNWLGLGATIVDSLDTLWIMGLMNEFEAAREWVAKKLAFNGASKSVSFFETTIRILGGLLSAYDLSGDEVFLARAKDLGRRLSVAFNTQSGIPMGSVNLQGGSASNPSWSAGKSVLAEAGTVQLEFLYLSLKTNDSSFGSKALRVIDVLSERNHGKNGLLGVSVNQNTGTCSGIVTLGALGDSYYEYLLKLHIFLGGRKNPEAAKFRRLYDEATDGIISKLVQRTSPSGLVYLADMNPSGSLALKMDHLACFAGAMFALGAAFQNSSSEGGPNHRSGEHLAIGAEITRTCHEMYVRMPSGVAPEFISIQNRDFAPGVSHNLLRPEAVESFFVLWRLTHNPIYREYGWQAFQAFEKNCRAAFGYSGLVNVQQYNPAKDNSQPSYFLAETLKYLYLLFSPDDVIPLDKYVFNTEAHPLSIQKP